MKFNIRTILQRDSLFSAFKKQDLFLHQSREWIHGLVFSMLLLGIGIFFVGFDFYNHFYAVKESVEVPVQTLEYDEKGVRVYAEKYDAKERAFTTLRKSRQAVTPPLPVIVPTPEATTTESINVPPLADVELGQ
jgi:hypothetical protein